MFRHVVLAGFLGLSVVALSDHPAKAQDTFPNRTITVVVPFSPGGAADLLARLAAEQIREAFGQSVVVENRAAGAGGLVGTESVYKAAPDGYTLLCAPQLTYSITHKLYPKLAFDPRSFEPMSVLASYPAVLVARPDLPAKNVQELIAYAKANPGKLNYASAGRGQLAHLTAEQLMHMAKIDLVQVPFRGSAPAVTALLGSQVDMFFDFLAATKHHIDSGKLKLLAVASRERLPEYPNVPTVGEVLPGFESDTWMGMSAPPGTPKEIVRKLSDAVARGFQKPEIKARIAAMSVEPGGTTPDEMRGLIKKSADRWLPLIESAKITID